jgi:threonyl-tRNA synthetase
MMKKPESNQDLHVRRHSLAHIMAASIQKLWPEAKFGVGPVVEHGFYYDVDLKQPLTPDDLAKIAAEMRRQIKENLKFERFELGIDEAIAKYKQEKQDYKVDLLADLKKHGTTNIREVGSEQLGVRASDEKVTTVTLYRTGSFEDLCRGPHLKSTRDAGAFKLTKVSGAYWRGDQTKAQLQRVYGLGFSTEEELNKFLNQLSEAEKRDHRKLGQELNLFIHSEIVGSGLPLFTPRGTGMINSMMHYVREINERDGYQEVRTGHVTREELYEKSGHADKFGDDLFIVEAGDPSTSLRAGDKLALKPMNCPHHIQLYAEGLRSYRDLPIKYAEFSTLHRNEVKGALGGLTRVRSLTQDDAHAFVREDQIEAEIEVILAQVDEVLKAYGLDYYVRLSLRDPKDMHAYLGNAKVWDKAEKLMEELATKFKMEYVTAEGEAAFYGPKMDFMATDAIGREWQVSTIQLDFNQPTRFDITYIGEDGQPKTPVMIHRALNGTFERMLGVLIEHYAGKFPLWLAPEQVRLVTVNDDKRVQDFARKLHGQMSGVGLRSAVDDSNESVGKKIRAAELDKVPYTLVIGEKEATSGKVVPRIRSGHAKKESGELSAGQFITALVTEAQTRAPKSSL